MGGKDASAQQGEVKAEKRGRRCFREPEALRPSDWVLIALADPTRRTIFEILSRSGEGLVPSLATRLGITPQATLKHLNILEHAGLVTCLRGAGHVNLYRTRPRGTVPLIDWLVGWLAAGTDYHETESECVPEGVAERPPPLKWPGHARYRERKLAERLATMSPMEAAALLADHERRKRVWAKRRAASPNDRYSFGD